MADSLIRLRQLNTAELSGFVSGLFSLLPSSTPTGSIIPSASGIANLGSSSYPYHQVFAQQIRVDGDSGIYFGSTPFRAFTSGGAAYVDVGGIQISSSGDYVFIQGPSGDAGPSGATGPSGASGIGVTGVTYNTTSHLLTFYLSDNTSTGFNFQGLSGATGVSVTGFFQSGGYIYPQYDHFNSTGEGIQLVAGPQGLVGGINFYFEKSGAGVRALDFPSEAIITDYYTASSFPPISLMRGMSYVVDASGLNTHQITADDITLFSSVFTGGQAIPWSEGDWSNYISSGDLSGYWRMAFWPAETATGYYSGDSSTYPSIFAETTNQEVMGSTAVPNYFRTALGFNVKFTAQDHYKYGFMSYTIGGDLASDIIIDTTGFAFVVGDAYCSSGVGPVGPQGTQGVQGIQGLQGPIGPTGPEGSGISVSSYLQENTAPNVSRLRFVFSDSSLGPWIDLPSGGPSGASGVSGQPGTLANHFKGSYSGTTNYATGDVVINSGSSFVYVNSISGTGHNTSDASYWQMIAQKGDTGPTGATGYADRFYTSYTLNTGERVWINGVATSGTGMRFAVNDTVIITGNGLTGLAYSPNSNLIFTTNSYTGSYFYGLVNSYTGTNGQVSVLVQSLTGIADTTISGGKALWYNYDNVVVNLGANTVSGAQGLQGVQGIQGPPGNPSVMRFQNYLLPTGYGTLLLQPTGLNITGGTGIDIFNIIITGAGQIYGGNSVFIDVNWSGVQTGQSLIFKIRNSGVPDGNSEPPLFYFSGVNMIKWPNGLYSRPNGGEAYIYTVLRFPSDAFETFSCYGTYSNPYV